MWYGPRAWGPLALVALSIASAGPAYAQGVNPAQVHVLHVLEAFPQTPGGEGLLSVAIAEATVAIQLARLAGNDPFDDYPMRQHADHVLHAVDPTDGTDGPGLGFGVRRAAEAIVQHIELAMSADGASANIRTHGAHVAEAARAVAARADEVVAMVHRIHGTAVGDYTTAYERVEDLQRLTGQLMTRVEATGEPGLEYVEQHMALLAAGEGLGR